MILSRGPYFGGAELQMSILSKELVKRSYDVSFITFGEKSSFYETYDDIKVYCAFNSKFKGYSYLHPYNIYSLIKILHKIEADIYIKKGYSPLTGIMAFIAKLQNKKFFFIASSDKDLSGKLDASSIDKWPNIFYQFGVKNCTRVICQTNHQLNLLEQKVGKKGIIIKNLYHLTNKENVKRDPKSLKILWIGRLIHGKRPELFLRLAKQLPDYRFWIIISRHPLDVDYYDQIYKEAIKIDNLDFLGYIPYKEIKRFYAESSMLISTSISEGFPNTFLEAWGNSIPVVSIGFDPDEIICNNGLGVHIENFEDLVKNVDMLIKNDRLREKMGMHGRKYVEAEHSVIRIVDEYEKLFNHKFF